MKSDVLGPGRPLCILPSPPFPGSVHIGLINAYSTLNLGDAAIYAGLRSLLPGAVLQAQVRDDAPDRSLGIQFTQEPPHDCDAYVSVGGDIFNNARQWFVTRTFLENLGALFSHRRKTILFGQSIPRSCNGLAFLLLCRVLRRLPAVCVRDAESHRRLRSAGVQARLSFDTAFALEGAERGTTAAAQLFQALAVPPERAVVLSVRAFDSMYSHDNDLFVHNMVSLCRGIVDRGSIPLLLIQSRAYGADNDLEVSRSIVESVPEATIMDPFRAEPDCSAWQIAMGVFSLAQHVIAVRYHTAVLSLATGRIPYSIHYSNKGRDLCERLSLPGCSLEGMAEAAILDSLFSLPATGFDHGKLRSSVRQAFQACMASLPATEES